MWLNRLISFIRDGMFEAERVCSRLAFCMKTAHTFSFLRTTSDIFASSLSQREASATFVFRHLSLFFSLQEAASFFLIGRSVMQRRGQLACSRALFHAA